MFDRIQSFSHVFLSPMNIGRLGQLDANLFASSIESSRRDTIFDSSFLNCHSIFDGLQSIVQVALAPGCGHSVERLCQLDPFLPGDLVQSLMKTSQKSF